MTPDPNDLAPTTGTPARLRRTDEEQPGKEMMHLALFGDGKSGLAVMMSSGALPNGQTLFLGSSGTGAPYEKK